MVKGFPMAELVARTGVAAATIRYYVSTGLLPAPRRIATNRFLYDARHVESLRLVRLLRERRRLPLSAIRRILPELLELPAAGAFRPEMWDDLVDARLAGGLVPSQASRLLDAGAAAFARHGYAEVRVDDICRSAQIAKGSFYRHFASKEELFFACVRRMGAEVAERFRAAAERPLEPSQAVDVLAEALEPHLPMLLDLFALAAQRRPGHGRVLREVFTDLYRVVSAGLVATAPNGAAEEALLRAVVVGLRRLLISPLLEAELFSDELVT